MNQYLRIREEIRDIKLDLPLGDNTMILIGDSEDVFSKSLKAPNNRIVIGSEEHLTTDAYFQHLTRDDHVRFPNIPLRLVGMPLSESSPLRLDRFQSTNGVVPYNTEAEIALVVAGENILPSAHNSSRHEWYVLPDYDTLGIYGRDPIASTGSKGTIHSQTELGVDMRLSFELLDGQVPDLESLTALSSRPREVSQPTYKTDPAQYFRKVPGSKKRYKKYLDKHKKISSLSAADFSKVWRYPQGTLWEAFLANESKGKKAHARR